MAKKTIDLYLREYCKRLSEDQFKFISQRFSQKFQGDIDDALIFLGETKELDKWLSSASSSKEFYDMLDSVHFSIEKEITARQSAAWRKFFVC